MNSAKYGNTTYKITSNLQATVSGSPVATEMVMPSCQKCQDRDQHDRESEAEEVAHQPADALTSQSIMKEK